MINDKKHTSEILLEERVALVNKIPDGKSSVFLEQNTGILDDYFRNCFETSTIGPAMGLEKNPYVFVALGGYGRAELCLHSDVDLLFVFKEEVSLDAENLIQEIVYPLWDIGLDVGYALRSLDECIELAHREFEILIPLLDARFICGVSPVFTRLMSNLEKEIFSRKQEEIVSWLIGQAQKRHKHFGDSTYRLEPNIKEGQGGLRDYHTMLWLARIQFNLKTPRDLEYSGRLSHDEFTELNNALDFIWDVRNRLHHISGRRCDQLHFENQIKLAESMKFKKINGHRPVERFLGELHHHMDLVKQQHLMFLYELGYIRKGKPRKQSPKKTKIKGLTVEREMLNFSSLEEILKSPELLIRIFEESTHLKIPLCAEAKRIIREFSYLADKNYYTSFVVIKSFEKILLAPAPVFNVLKEMLNTGFLVHLFPEIKGVINLIQYDEYHVFPVDLHLLRTVQTIKNFAVADDIGIDPLYSEVYHEIKKKKLLLWAALFHDIGKANSSGDHAGTGAVIVESMLTDRGLKPEDVKTVSFLVKKHLMLVKIASRRDIHDEETVLSCAREVADIEQFKMLYLLNVADSMATGPNAWNDWIETLLRTLFIRVLNILEKGELASQEVIEDIEKKKIKVLSLEKSDEARKELESLFAVLSPRYLLYATSSEIREDIKHFKELGDREFIWSVTRWESANTRTVKVCAKDRPGLFSKLAGIFTLNNMDIIDARIFTWRNRIAVDIFEVKAPRDRLFENETWARAEKDLNLVILGELDIASELREKTSRERRVKSHTATRPSRIVVDNDSSSFFTIIEVFTYDYPGLLFTITDALFRCRLDIWVAKIATKSDQVVDIFYVRDFDGQKADSPDQVEEIKSTIKKGIIHSDK